MTDCRCGFNSLGAVYLFFIQNLRKFLHIDNFLRGIRISYFRTVKTLFWPWFRQKTVMPSFYSVLLFLQFILFIRTFTLICNVTWTSRRLILIFINLSKQGSFRCFKFHCNSTFVLSFIAHFTFVRFVLLFLFIILFLTSKLLFLA